jgi:hypothetical protein
MSIRWLGKAIATLIGNEVIPCTQGGVDMYTTPQDIHLFRNTRTLVTTASLVPDAIEDILAVTALDQDLNVANPIGTAKDGYTILLRIKDDGTSRNLTFGTAYRASNGPLPTATVVGAWTSLNAVYNATDSKWDILIIPSGGTGDVVGPASSTDGDVVVFDGTSGKLLKSRGALGTAAFTASTAYATAAQGALADSALQAADIVGLAQNRNVVSVLTISSGLVTIDFSLGDYFTLSLTENVTGWAYTNVFPGCSVGVVITNHSPLYTVAWDGAMKWPDGDVPAVTALDGAIDLLGLTTVDTGTTMLASLKNYA